MNLTFEELKVKSSNIYRSINYNSNSVPPEFIDAIDTELNFARNNFESKAGYKIIYDINIGKVLKLNNTNFTIGPELEKLLNKSEYVIVFICTAGEKITLRNRELYTSNKYLEAYTNDIIGNIIVERTADFLLKHIKKTFTKLKVTNRYSPGNCGWEIMAQKDFFSLFPHNFIGVTLSDSQMMLPIKSLNGIIGIGEKVKFIHNTCDLCKSIGCIYRKVSSN